MSVVYITGNEELNNFVFIYPYLNAMISKDDTIVFDLDFDIGTIISTFTNSCGITSELIRDKSDDGIIETIKSVDKVIVFWNNKDLKIAKIIKAMDSLNIRFTVIPFKDDDILKPFENVVHCKVKPYDIYIGRPSKFQNPIKLVSEEYRLRCISEFAYYLLNKPSLLESIPELTGYVLGCWCRDKSDRLCHGDVLMYILNQQEIIDSQKVIAYFKNNYDFLSNFYRCDVPYRGHVYATVEHAYQAAKTEDIQDKLKIQHAISPNRAKRLGNQVKLIPGWDILKFDIMRELIAAKFENIDLAKKLVATGNKILIEGNHCHDTQFGVCYCKKCKGKNIGNNHLGKILMEQRKLCKQKLKELTYIERLSIPITGKDIPLFTKSKLPISIAYNRIVIGDRGPYVEFTKEQLITNNITILEEESWRISNTNVYYVMHISLDSKLSIYEQKKKVKYADYIPGLYYISPFDLYTENNKVLIEPIKNH